MLEGVEKVENRHDGWSPGGWRKGEGSRGNERDHLKKHHHRVKKMGLHHLTSVVDQAGKGFGEVARADEQHRRARRLLGALGVVLASVRARATGRT